MELQQEVVLYFSMVDVRYVSDVMGRGFFCGSTHTRQLTLLQLQVHSCRNFIELYIWKHD